MPIVNTCAFLFTVLGEWWVEGKVISRGRACCYIQLRPIANLCTRYLDWHVFIRGWNCIVCTEQECLDSLMVVGVHVLYTFEGI